MKCLISKVIIIVKHKFAKDLVVRCSLRKSIKLDR